MSERPSFVFWGVRPEVLLFSGRIGQELTQKERLEMVRAMTTHQFEDGDVVVSSGHPVDRFVIVEDGEVHVRRTDAAGGAT